MIEAAGDPSGENEGGDDARGARGAVLFPNKYPVTPTEITIAVRTRMLKPVAGSVVIAPVEAGPAQVRATLIGGQLHGGDAGHLESVLSKIVSTDPSAQGSHSTMHGR